MIVNADSLAEQVKSEDREQRIRSIISQSFFKYRQPFRAISVAYIELGMVCAQETGIFPHLNEVELQIFSHVIRVRSVFFWLMCGKASGDKIRLTPELLHCLNEVRKSFRIAGFYIYQHYDELPFGDYLRRERRAKELFLADVNHAISELMFYVDRLRNKETFEVDFFEFMQFEEIIANIFYGLLGKDVYHKFLVKFFSCSQALENFVFHITPWPKGRH